MSTSRFSWARHLQGFTLIELLLGLALGLLLTMAVAPLLTSLQARGVEEADRSVQVLQARVAIARFERDLRLASAERCAFAVDGPVLDAGTSRVVLLVRSDDGSAPILVEWEVSGSSLMRRWGPCPASRPTSVTTSLFVDHKTMLAGVTPASRFTFYAGAEELPTPVTAAKAAQVDRVLLDLRIAPSGSSYSQSVRSLARVGR